MQKKYIKYIYITCIDIGIRMHVCAYAYPYLYLPQQLRGYRIFFLKILSELDS